MKKIDLLVMAVSGFLLSGIVYLAFRAAGRVGSGIFLSRVMGWKLWGVSSHLSGRLRHKAQEVVSYKYPMRHGSARNGRNSPVDRWVTAQRPVWS